MADGKNYAQLKLNTARKSSKTREKSITNNFKYKILAFTSKLAESPNNL